MATCVLVKLSGSYGLHATATVPCGICTPTSLPSGEPTVLSLAATHLLNAGSVTALRLGAALTLTSGLHGLDIRFFIL